MAKEKVFIMSNFSFCNILFQKSSVVVVSESDWSWERIKESKVATSTVHLSHSARKPTLRTLRKVSTRINLSVSRRLIRADIFRLLWIFCFRNHYSIPISPLRRNVSARISLRGLRRLIWVDTLRIVHKVGFLVERIMCYIGKPSATSGSKVV